MRLFLFIVNLLVVLVATLSCVTAVKERKQKQVWIDGLNSDDTAINCPSLRFADSLHFSPRKKETSSIRCSSCDTMRNLIVRRASILVHKKGKTKLSQTFLLEGLGERVDSSSSTTEGENAQEHQNEPATGDLAGAFCEALYDIYELKQKPDGYRIWARRAKFAHVSLDDEREALVKTHLVPGHGEDPDEEDLMPLKFHTPEERRLLPCARYFHRELCFRALPAAEEAIEECIEQASTIVSLRKSKSDEMWAERLNDCVDAALMCKPKWCHSRLLAEVKKQEHLHFSWYEGAFGNDRFNYVADTEKRGRNKLNEYRRKGDLAHLNPWLNGTWDRVEDL